MCAMAAFVWSALLWSALQRKKRAMPRMKVAMGVVRTMKTRKTGVSRHGTQRSYTDVDVEFAVDNRSYRCVDLYLFGGNGHVGDVGKKFDFPPGHIVGVYYDPENPKLNAMVFNGPSHFMCLFAAGMGVLFMILAATAAR